MELLLESGRLEIMHRAFVILQNLVEHGDATKEAAVISATKNEPAGSYQDQNSHFAKGIGVNDVIINFAHRFARNSARKKKRGAKRFRQVVLGEDFHNPAYRRIQVASMLEISVEDVVLFAKQRRRG